MEVEITIKTDLKEIASLLLAVEDRQAKRMSATKLDSATVEAISSIAKSLNYCHEASCDSPQAN